LVCLFVVKKESIYMIIYKSNTHLNLFRSLSQLDNDFIGFQ